MNLAAPCLALAALLPARAAEPPVHCQVPCGIYGDSMRIEMLLEDALTVEKAMSSIRDLSSASSPDYNQLVRWVVNKEEHAQKIQDQVAVYWLAQRIKAPAEESGRGVYLRQLELMHGITVSAMKCKQTTEKANVDAVRANAQAFAETYFSEEDLEHLRGEHGGHGHR